MTTGERKGSAHFEHTPAGGSEEPSFRLLRAGDEVVEVVDDDTIRRVASEVQAILNRTLARGMDEVGAFLLKEFYNDDIRAYRSPSPAKHLSLRKLVERCGTMELPVTATFLSMSIRMSALARSLPPSTSFTRLPISHRIELLRLPQHAVEAVAARALRDHTPVRELRTEVRRLLEPTQRRGRPAIPPFVRAVSDVERALNELRDAMPRPPSHGAELSREQRLQLGRTLERTEAVLSELRGTLRTLDVERSTDTRSASERGPASRL